MRAIVCMRRKHNINKYLLCLVSLLVSAQALSLEIESPAILLTNVPAEITVSGALPEEQVRLSVAGTARFTSADAEGTAVFSDVIAGQRGSVELLVSSGDDSSSASLRVLPLKKAVSPMARVRMIPRCRDAPGTGHRRPQPVRSPLHREWREPVWYSRDQRRGSRCCRCPPTRSGTRRRGRDQW